MTWTLHEGDCLEILKTLPSESVDSIVTDPPYELGFMGKAWDASGITYNVDMWKEVLRVLKPGGHLLAFGGTRTYHRMACAIEDAGFEIRDQLQWLYGSGFPKSMDVSKAIDKHAGAERCGALSGGHMGYSRSAGDLSNEGELGTRVPHCVGKGSHTKGSPATPEAQEWDGWGTALKPANEPICLARKPLSEKTIAENVLEWGTGGVNIDGCRIETSDNLSGTGGARKSQLTGDERTTKGAGLYAVGDGAGYEQSTKGRFPANVILDEEAGRLLDEQSGISKSSQRTGQRSGKEVGRYGNFTGQDNVCMGHNDKGGASRFFYCAKASKKDRAGSKHPTVKPIKLMRYLCRLITPPGGTILDPFAGSGTTIQSAIEEGFNIIGIELQEEYCQDIRQRMKDTVVQSELGR